MKFQMYVVVLPEFGVARLFYCEKEARDFDMQESRKVANPEYKDVWRMPMTHSVEIDTDKVKTFLKG